MVWLPIFISSILAVATALKPGPLDGKSRPNIVFILTDDQDIRMDSLSYMPLLKKYITNEGTLYKRHYCSAAICCPSRVTLWTGKNTHNTNVTDVSPPYGGYPKFISQGLNENWLPIWLQEAGYNTFYAGKLINAMTISNYDKPYVAGWNTSDLLLDPYSYQYFNATTQRNHDPPISWEGYYSTDVIAAKAYGMLEDALDSDRPFFLTVATSAPHSSIGTYDPNDFAPPPMVEPIPADRHRDLFPDAKVPRTENFNPEKPSGAGWVKTLPLLNSTQIDYNDHFYRARLRTLQAVDEIVEGMVTRLQDAGILDNTYVMYSSDNGFHISQHRLPPGKTCGFEEDINIPLIIRGPTIPKGEITDVVTAHSDLSPTFLKIAGAPQRPDFDGTPIPLNEEELAEAIAVRQEHVNIEFWGKAIPEGIYDYTAQDGNKIKFFPNNTYKAIRLISAHHNLYYSVWCTNEHELYDLATDPYQTTNLYPPPSHQPAHKPQSPIPIPLPLTYPSTSPSTPLTHLLTRLDALLLILKSCKGHTCHSPWSVLHPSGKVHTLSDALAPRYDLYYTQIQSVASVGFQACEPGHLIEVEGPQGLPAWLEEGGWERDKEAGRDEL